MDTFDLIYERIKQVTGTRTQVDLAKILDIRQSSISDAKRRKSVPADWILTLFDIYAVNPDWIKRGNLPQYFGGEHQWTSTQMPQKACDLSRGVKKTIFDGNLNNGSDPMENGNINLPEKFASENIMVVVCRESSMAPDIRKGSFVGINTAVTRFGSCDVCALKMPYEGIILRKAVVNSLDEQVTFWANHDLFPPIIFRLEEASERLLGRVEWVLQQI